MAEKKKSPVSAGDNQEQILNGIKLLVDSINESNDIKEERLENIEIAVIGLQTSLNSIAISVKEISENGIIPGGGGSEQPTNPNTPITVEDEKVTVVEDGTPIKLKNKNLELGSVEVKNSEGKPVGAGYVINYRDGMITFNGTEAESKFTISYRTTGLDIYRNYKSLDIKEGKISEVTLNSLTNNEQVGVMEVVEDTNENNGEIQYDELTKQFITSAAKKDFNITAVGFNPIPGKVEVNRKTAVGSSNHVTVTLRELFRNPVVFAFPLKEDANEAKIGEVWVSDLTAGTFRITNTGRKDAQIGYVAFDKSANEAGIGTGSFTKAGTEVTHGLKLDPKKYMVLVQPSSKTEGKLGDVWVERKADSFVVHSTGDSDARFNYIILEHEA